MMNLNTNANTFKWILNCVDGKHTVVLQQLSSPREPMQLYVDGERTDISRKNKSPFVIIKHSFTCVGEPALLLIFGNKVDLVFQGMLQTAKKKYDFRNIIPGWILILTLLLNAIPLIVSKWNSLSLMMSFSCCVLVYLFSLNPIYSRKEKWLRIVLFTLLNWGIAIACLMLF